MAKDDPDPLMMGHRESTGVSQEPPPGGSSGAEGHSARPSRPTCQQVRWVVPDRA